MEFRNNQEVLDYVNSLGGRTVGIIVLEKCEWCTKEFFSTVQDSRFKASSGAPVLCATCKAEDTRQKKNEAERERRQRKRQ